jgi:DNA-binding transcriptional MerR regulator
MPTHRVPASATKARYQIGDVAEMTGLSTHVIRVWELRYGWPVPERAANGFRYYSESLVGVLEWVATQIAHGRTIGEILRDPMLPREEGADGGSAKPERSTLDFSHIPDPVTADGLRLRRSLEQAIATKDEGTKARIQAESLRLKPEERERACGALLRVQR